MELDRRRQFLQMCDVIHDGPAFDRMTLGVDEVKVDLGEIKKSYIQRPDQHQLMSVDSDCADTYTVEHQ